MRNAWLACSLLIMATAAGLAGCSRGGFQAGHAFTHDFPISTGAKPIRPGTEIGLLDLYLDNGTSSTVVINSIGISGPGAGTVIRPVKVEIAPLRFGRRNYEKNAVPSALYSTDPPVFFYGRKCHKQALFPAKGYRMTPGSQVRVWIVLRALRPGKWVIPDHVVNYAADGTRYRQVIPLREHGSVAAHATYIPPDWAEAKCVGPEKASFLPGYHAGRVSN
jgi:hypothetical protein